MDSTSNLWHSSLQRTKEIRLNLARSKDRIELPQPGTAHTIPEVSDDKESTDTEEIAKEPIEEESKKTESA